MLPSKFILFITNREIIINGKSHLFEMYIMLVCPQDYYLINWRNGKYVQIWKSCGISQKTINKNAMHLESLLELLEGDNECLILANQILGETRDFYTTWNIVKRLI